MQLRTALTLGLISLATAAPSDPLENLRKANRIEGRKAGSLSSLSEALAHLENAQASLSSSGAATLQKRQTPKGRASTTGGDPLGAYYGYIWPVKIGAQILDMIFATEIPDFWVYSSKLPAAQKQGHTVYNRKGKLLSGRKWEKYASAGPNSRIAGDNWNDTVTIGGYTAWQEIEALTYLGKDSAAESAQYDGTVGWGWPSGKTGCFPTDCKPWWSSLYTQLPNQGFSVGLGINKPAVWDQGFVDPAKYSGEMFYAQGYNARTGWDILAPGWSAGTQPIKKLPTGDLWTTFNPDLEFILADPAIVDGYHKNVKGAKRVAEYGNIYIFPCNSAKPAFNLFIESPNGSRTVKRSMPGSLLSIFTVDEFPGYCLSAIQDLFHDQLYIAAGIPFMKANYIHYSNDLAQGFTPPYLGFALAK